MTNKLTLVTYNVFSHDMNNDKFQKISDILNNTNAHIICLQKVTDDLLQFLLNQKWTAFYFFSIRKLNQPGEIIMSKFQFLVNNKIPFKKSLANKCINIVDIALPINSFPPNGETIIIITSELDELEQLPEYRIDQLYDIFNLVSQFDESVFFLGNTNITDTGNDNIDIVSPWKDCWINIGEPNDIKYTYNSDVNDNISGFSQKRPDRIIYRSEDWRLCDYKLIGMEDSPSCHFGIKIEIEK